MEGTALHKEFAHSLNVVILVKRNLRTQAQAHVILFSSDLTLAAATLVDSYRLRFQIEFNCRDAKQFWGLEDCMTVTPNTVTNAANLSLFTVNLSRALLTNWRTTHPDASQARNRVSVPALWTDFSAASTISLRPNQPASLGYE